MVVLTSSDGVSNSDHTSRHDAQLYSYLFCKREKVFVLITAGGEHNHADRIFIEVLLMLKVFIKCDQGFEIIFKHKPQEVAVAYTAPALFAYGIDLVLWKGGFKTSGQILIKQ